jgi:hypothetical protein
MDYWSVTKHDEGHMPPIPAAAMWGRGWVRNATGSDYDPKWWYTMPAVMYNDDRN